MIKKIFFAIISFSFVFSVSAQDRVFDESVYQIIDSMKYSNSKSKPQARKVEVCSSQNGNTETITSFPGAPSAKLQINFDFDSAKIKDDSKYQAKKAGTAIKILYKEYEEKGKPLDAIYIKGYADSTGDEKYNKKLSYKRALSVKKYLQTNFDKLSNINLDCYGYGESFPIVENEKTELDKQKNRRVELSLTR